MSYGLESDRDYPFTGKDDQKCTYNKENVICEIKGYTVITPGNETELVLAIANNGPIPVGIDAGQPSFQFYQSGIYYEPNCSQNIDHLVLVVGYGTINNNDYYIVKNR